MSQFESRAVAATSASWTCGFIRVYVKGKRRMDWRQPSVESYCGKVHGEAG